MKKLLVILFLTFCVVSFAQLSHLIINNYSPYQVKTRFGASSSAGNCIPAVSSNPPAGTSLFNIPAAFNPGLTPFTTEYEKYAYSNSSAIPIMEWFVKTSSTSPGINRVYNHPVLTPLGPVAQNTDWSYFSFQTHDGNGNSFDDFYLSLSALCAGAPITTYISGTYSEAETFTITSGSTIYTYAMIY